MSISRLWTAALVAATLTVAGPAQAVPTYYEFTDGSATVRVTVGTVEIANSEKPLDGVFATFDGDGNGTLVDFEFSLQEDSAVGFFFPLGAYDSIVIHSATLTPGGGYGHFLQVDNGGGNYTIGASPIETTTSISVLSSSLGPGATEMLGYSGLSIDPLIATIDVATGTTFTLDGISLGQFTHADFATIPVGVTVVVKLDLTFEGMVPVPEPTMGVLFGLGLAGLAVLRARRI